jgi:hypothetical protein
MGVQARYAMKFFRSTKALPGKQCYRIQLLDRSVHQSFQLDNALYPQSYGAAVQLERREPRNGHINVISIGSSGVLGHSL